jgi:hypothetical protein
VHTLFQETQLSPNHEIDRVAHLSVSEEHRSLGKRELLHRLPDPGEEAVVRF